ncbi:MAG TPA: hypothetical protein PKW80_12375 [Bacteroidales bacterium]|nr:hypothetical protein [Bacteroidales bacterium]
MKKLLILLVLIGPVLITELPAQNRFNTSRRNIKNVNNELIEYQKDGLINWTQGYLEGVGKESVTTPDYENIATLYAYANLGALYENIYIYDTLTLTKMAEKNEVFRKIIKAMNAEIRGASTSPVEIKNDTCYVRTSIDFETLLIFKYNDATLLQWINKFYQPAKKEENQNVVVNNIKVPVHTNAELKIVQDSLEMISSKREINSDTITIYNDKKIGVIANNNSNPTMLAGVQNIYIRLNGKLYNPTPNFDYGELVPVKWQPLVNLSVNTLLEITSTSEKAPRWLKAIQMEDGSIVYDIDKIIEKKEKWQKVGDFVLQLIDVIIGIVK